MVKMVILVVVEGILVEGIGRSSGMHWNNTGSLMTSHKAYVPHSSWDNRF
jgi:hypothetical protein